MPSHAYPTLKELERGCWKQFLYWLLQARVSKVLLDVEHLGSSHGLEVNTTELLAGNILRENALI